MLALLAMSPQRRRSRAWLQGLLWSDRAPDQAAGSLRRTLCDLHRTFAEAPAALGADRFEIWLTDAVRIDPRDDLIGRCELLEAIEVPDAAFDEWLREVRAGDGTFDPSTNPLPSKGKSGFTAPRSGSSDGTDRSRTEALVLICVTRTGADRGQDLMAVQLVDALSERLEAEGAVALVIEDGPSADRPAQSQTAIRIEISTVAEHGYWNVYLRALADANRRFLWSGRLRLTQDLHRITVSADIPAFVSTSLTQILARYRACRPADASPYLTIQRAAVRLFDADWNSLRQAEQDLSHLPNGEWTPIALAWQAFARLTHVIEFGQTDPDIAGEAISLAAQALRARPDNPLVAALAARVTLKLEGDIDRAHYLAQAAMRSGDRNPYSYNSAAQVDLIRGDWQAAYVAARRGRLMSEGLPHAHCWDMQLCLTALGIGDVAMSIKVARIVHAKAPSYRPALRYLTALCLLEGDPAGADLYATRLRTREPGFDPIHLLRPDYPMHTLRATGYAATLPAPR